MRHRAALFFAVAFSASAIAESPTSSICPGWMRANLNDAGYEATIDRQVTHSGAASLRIVASDPPAANFGGVAQVVRADAYRGKRVRFSAFVRTESVTQGGAAIWFRVDDVDGRIQEFDNMFVSDRALTGTQEWRRVEAVLDVPESAGGLFYGALLKGSGSMWMDTTRIEVVGFDVATTVPVSKAKGTNPVLPANVPTAPSNLDFES